MMEMDQDRRMALPVIRNPCELDLTLSAESVDHYKNWDCKGYEICMNRAADLGWQQFHCRNCTAYDPRNVDLDAIAGNRKSVE